MNANPNRREWLAGAATLGLAGCAATSNAPPVAALVPTGRLRASINLGNPILAARRPDGEVTGVSVDLARAMGTRLGVPVELVVVDAAAKSVEAVKSGNADIGFFAVDPQRGEGIRFSAPYVLIEGSYLVRLNSPLRDNAEVDRAGTRVMVARGSAYDLYLSRNLKAATLMHTVTSQSVVDRFLAENADVAAGVKQQLQADAARLPGLRLLPGRFMVIEQAMGLPAGRGPEAQAWLRAFVEQAKSEGTVAAALQRHGIQGAAVAPPG